MSSSFSSLSSIPPWQIFPSISYPCCVVLSLSVSRCFKQLLSGCLLSSLLLPAPSTLCFVSTSSLLSSPTHTLFGATLPKKTFVYLVTVTLPIQCTLAAIKTETFFFLFLLHSLKRKFSRLHFRRLQRYFLFLFIYFFCIYFFDVLLAQVLFASAREKKVWQKYFCFFTCEWMLKLFFSSFAAFLHHLCFSSSPIRALLLAFLHTFWS